MTERTDFTPYWDLSPRVIMIATPSSEVTMQDLVDTMRALEDDLTNMDDDHVIDASGKEALGGGTYVGITVNLQNARIGFKARSTSIAEGTAATDLSGYYLQDNSASFSVVDPGALVLNITDRSVTTVLQVLSATKLYCQQLEDGTNNYWSLGDDYKIWNVETCDVSGGNLVAVDDVGADLNPIFPTAFTQIVKASSSSATLQELLDIQHSSFNNGVTIDVVGGTDGTDYPTGTPRQPVSNFVDANSIATLRGFTKYFLVGNHTIGSGDDLSGYIIEGYHSYHDFTTITLATGCVLTNTQFQNVLVKGDADNNFIIIQDGSIGDLDNLDANIYRTELGGLMTLNLSGVYQRHWIRCTSKKYASPPTLDFQNTDQSLVMTGYTGSLKVINMNAGLLDISLDSGSVRVATSCTGGTVKINGTGQLVDTSAGTTVEASNLVNPYTVADQVWDEKLAGHGGSGSAGEALSNVGSPPPATVDTGAIADAVWDELVASHLLAGSFGKYINNVASNVASPSLFRADISNLALQSTLSAVETVVNSNASILASPLAFKADVTALALQSTLTNVQTNVASISDYVSSPLKFKADVSALASPLTFKADVSGLAQESTATAIKAKTDTINWPDMTRALGLMQENFRIKNQAYNANNLLTSASILIYGSASDAQNDVSPTDRYQLSATYNANGECTSYVVIKV